MTKTDKYFSFDKALFILPTSFTVTSVIFSMYAIFNIASDNTDLAAYRSSIAILFSCLFDMFDGRIARMTKTQSDFGMQLDSLADTVSFGVAPAVIMYQWSVDQLGYLGMLCCAFYTICGIIRLARFNVIEIRSQYSDKQEESSSNFFTGLPIPVPAALIAGIIITSYKMSIDQNILTPDFFAFILVGLGLLKVSSIKYSPGLIRIFVEVLSNAIDNVWRSSESGVSCTKIKVVINEETGESPGILITNFDKGASARTFSLA